MNQKFFEGFVKAARASGFNNAEIDVLLKQALGEDPNAAGLPPQGPVPPAPALGGAGPAGAPPMPTGGPAGAPPMGGGDPMAAGLGGAAGMPFPEDPAAALAGGEDPSQGGGDQLEQLLAQLSPEELEQLATELSGDMGQPGQEPVDESQIAQLAAAIEQHLGQNPELSELGGAEGGAPAGGAPMPGADAGAMEGLTDPAAGSAPGESPIPEEALPKEGSLNIIKSAAYIEGFLSQAVGRGLHVKEAVELYDAALTNTVNYIKEAQAVQKSARAIPYGEIDDKTAAYYEGVLLRAREYGLSDKQALELIAKQAGSVWDGAKGVWNSVKNTAKYSPKTTAAIATGGALAGAAGTVGISAAMNNKSE